jgi:multidrug transporter EmrE-like cation transporter
MHKLLDYSYIFLTIVFTIYGQFILKWRLNNLEIELPVDFFGKFLSLMKLVFDPFIFSGLLFAFFASLTWMVAMTKFELSFAYPFIALNFVIVFLLGIAFLGESFSFAKLTGVLFIVFGTVIVARS